MIPCCPAGQTAGCLMAYCDGQQDWDFGIPEVAITMRTHENILTFQPSPVSDNSYGNHGAQMVAFSKPLTQACLVTL